jgi:hypothetical protein
MSTASVSERGYGLNRRPMRTSLIEDLPISGIFNAAKLDAFQKKIGYPTVPALLLKTDEEQVMIIISSGKIKKKKQPAIVFCTGSMTDKEFHAKIRELRKSLSAIQ